MRFHRGMMKAQNEEVCSPNRLRTGGVGVLSGKANTITNFYQTKKA